MNYQKSILVHSQQMKILGFVVNSINLSLNLPRDKIRKSQSKCQIKISGPPVLFLTGSLPAPPLSLSPTGKKLCPQTSQILRGPGPPRLRLPPGRMVVKGQSSSMEWESPAPTNNRFGHRDRGFLSRLGVTFSGGVNRGQMASWGNLLPHKLIA